jgi:hypothetical protein
MGSCSARRARRWPRIRGRRRGKGSVSSSKSALAVGDVGSASAAGISKAVDGSVVTDASSLGWL